jgi:hypothetical protein
MKYVFTFNEINYGRIEVEADRRPDNGEIIEKILEGKADYHNTDFTSFKLIEVDGKVHNRDNASDDTEGLQTFEVTITETLQQTVTVTAVDPCEAEEKVEAEWNNQDHILDADNFVGAKFTAVPIL